jgi:hypothetical protein
MRLRLRAAVVFIAFGSVFLVGIAAARISGTSMSELSLLSSVASACGLIGLGLVYLLDIRRTPIVECHCDTLACPTASRLMGDACGQSLLV